MLSVGSYITDFTYNQEYSSWFMVFSVVFAKSSKQPALRRSRKIMTSLVPVASCQIGCAIHVALVIEVVCGAEFGGRSRGCCGTPCPRLFGGCFLQQCCGEVRLDSHSSLVEDETQLPTELREGLCWFSHGGPPPLRPLEADEVICIKLLEDRVQFSSNLIQGCLKMSSSKIL